MPPKKPEFKTNYQEVSLEHVLQFYVESYKFPKGETLFDYETFVDVAKGKVVFRLTTKLFDAKS